MAMRISVSELVIFPGKCIPLVCSELPLAPMGCKAVGDSARSLFLRDPHEAHEFGESGEEQFMLEL